jgi:hypothetical protein
MAEARKRAEEAAARRGKESAAEEAARKQEERLAAMSPAERSRWKARQEEKAKKRMFRTKWK